MTIQTAHELELMELNAKLRKANDTIDTLRQKLYQVKFLLVFLL